MTYSFPMVTDILLRVLYYINHDDDSDLEKCLDECAAVCLHWQKCVTIFKRQSAMKMIRPFLQHHISQQHLPYKLDTKMRYMHLYDETFGRHPCAPSLLTRMKRDGTYILYDLENEKMQVLLTKRPMYQQASTLLLQNKPMNSTEEYIQSDLADTLMGGYEMRHDYTFQDIEQRVDDMRELILHILYKTF